MLLSACGAAILAGIALLRGADAMIAGSVVLLMLFSGALIARSARRPAIACIEHLRPTDVCDEFGLTYHGRDHDGLHSRFARERIVPRRGHVRHVITGPWRGRTATAFQHTCHTGVGRSRRIHTRSVFALDAPSWPRVRVRRRNACSRALYRLGRQNGLMLDDDQFNHTTHVRTSDDDFAITMLAPTVQRWLLGVPFRSLHVGDGTVAIVLNGPMPLGALADGFNAVSTFRSMLSGELDDWQPRDVRIPSLSRTDLEYA